MHSASNLEKVSYNVNIRCKTSSQKKYIPLLLVVLKKKNYCEIPMGSIFS